ADVEGVADRGDDDGGGQDFYLCRGVGRGLHARIELTFGGVAEPDEDCEKAEQAENARRVLHSVRIETRPRPREMRGLSAEHRLWWIGKVVEAPARRAVQRNCP